MAVCGCGCWLYNVLPCLALLTGAMRVRQADPKGGCRELKWLPLSGSPPPQSQALKCPLGLPKPQTQGLPRWGLS